MIPAEQMISEKLENAGFQLSGNPRRADVIVRVRDETISNQDVQFYGQTATITTAYLSVRAFRGGRPLGSGMRQKIDYTPLNAEDKVQQAIDAHIARVVDSIK